MVLLVKENSSRSLLGYAYSHPAVCMGVLGALGVLAYVVTDNRLMTLCSTSTRTDMDALVAGIRQANTHSLNASVIQELYHAVNSERLTKIAQTYRKAYQKAEPFPHIAIDGIFPERFLEQVLLENPESNVQGGCLFGTSKNCFQEETQNKKSTIFDEDLMGLHTRILFGVLKSSPFIKFLEELTAIASILPDPHYRGSGLHFTAAGGNLNIHADFNKYAQGYNLDRRVNAFVFLNPDWPDDYGGHLELWSRDMRECHQKIAPTLGRFVVFSSTDFSYHGHPVPLACPSHRVRRSLALYYYTNGRPPSECLHQDCSGKGHSTMFQTPEGCHTCEDSSCYRVDPDDGPVPTVAGTTTPEQDGDGWMN